MNNKKNLNIEIDGKKIESIAERIGTLIGEGGRLISKIIDILQKL